MMKVNPLSLSLNKLPNVNVNKKLVFWFTLYPSLFAFIADLVTVILDKLPNVDTEYVNPLVTPSML